MNQPLKLWLQKMACPNFLFDFKRVAIASLLLVATGVIGTTQAATTHVTTTDYNEQLTEFTWKFFWDKKIVGFPTTEVERPPDDGFPTQFWDPDIRLNSQTLFSVVIAGKHLANPHGETLFGKRGFFSLPLTASTSPGNNLPNPVCTGCVVDIKSTVPAGGGAAVMELMGTIATDHIANPDHKDFYSLSWKNDPNIGRVDFILVGIHDPNPPPPLVDIPEPAALPLLALGGVIVASRRRRITQVSSKNM